MKGSLLFISLTLFFLFLYFANGNIGITEIMFNPDDGNEWAEFFNSGNVTSIEGMKIIDAYQSGKNQSDKIACCNDSCIMSVKNNSFFLITGLGSTPNLSDTQVFCVDDYTIGNGLGNSGDMIILERGNETLVNFSYNSSTRKGFSLALVNGSWIEAIPTPGGVNEDSNYLNETANQDRSIFDLELLFADEKLYTNSDYGSLIEIHNKNYPDISDTINLTLYSNLSYLRENETNNILLWENLQNVSFKHYTKPVDIYFNDSGNYLLCAKIISKNLTEFDDENISDNEKCAMFLVSDSSTLPCNISLSVETEKNIFESNESVSFDNILNNASFGFEIEYWVEDLFGNEAKARAKTNNLDRKHFSPDFDGSEKAFIIKSNLTKTACNNSADNTFSEKLVIVKGGVSSNSLQSNITITDYPEKAAFGDTINVGLSAYKGDTRKTLIDVYLKGDEKVSYVTSAKINDKFSGIEISLPVRLKDNCDSRYHAGTYTLIADGLNVSALKEIYLAPNTNCPAAQKAQASTSSKASRAAPLVSTPAKKTYELLSLIQDIFSGQVIVTVKIYNTENASHTYGVWSYLYDGRTSYSGEREANKVNISLEPFSDEAVVLMNRPDINAPGSLSVMIRVLREDRKSPYEIKQNITLNITKNNISKEKTQSETKSSEIPPPEFYNGPNNEGETTLSNSTGIGPSEKEINVSEQRITGNLVYESKAEKTKGIFILFVLLCIALGIFAFRNLRYRKEKLY